MTEAGFFAQKRSSPTSLALVILLHAAVLAAVIMIKSPVFAQLARTRTVVTLIDAERDPPPDPPPARRESERESHITQTRTIVDTGPRNNNVITTWDPPAPPPGTGIVIAPPPP